MKMLKLQMHNSKLLATNTTFDPNESFDEDLEINFDDFDDSEIEDYLAAPEIDHTKPQYYKTQSAAHKARDRWFKTKTSLRDFGFLK